jgi:F-type H+-transporting ATPase subunit b
MEFYLEPEFWVAISFFLFVGLLFYYAVPRKLAEALDKRAKEIALELEEARKLRQEAESVLADYRRREKEAEGEAEDIVKLATKEARSYAAETRKSMQEQFERRTKLAEEKIGRAEAQAVADVRAAAIDAAVGAARMMIAQKLTPETANKLLEKGIDSLKSKLN